MKWTALFRRRILDRGYGYYLDERVKNLKQENEKLTALVLGTELYEVEIEMEEDNIGVMSCTCPYAAEGDYCKHMAAVLFEWSERNGDDQPFKLYEEDLYEDEDDYFDEDEFFDDDYYDEDEEFETYMNSSARNCEKWNDYESKLREKLINDIEKTDIEIIKDFLVSVLQQDEKLRMRFYNIIKPQIMQADIARYKQRIDGIATHYLGKEGYIDHSKVLEFGSDVEELIANDIEQMIFNKQYLPAMEILEYILVMLNDLDIDDSWGTTWDIAQSVEEAGIKILAQLNASYKQNLFYRFMIIVKSGEVQDHIEEVFVDLMMRHFPEKEFENMRFDFVTDMLAQMLNEGEDSDEIYMRDYYVSYWLDKYIEMIPYCSNKSERESFLYNKYGDEKVVREYYFKTCLEQKNYQEAATVLDKCIELAKTKGMRYTQYIEKKKEIYLLMNDKESYRQVLWELMQEHKRYDLGTYKELKKQYPQEQWIVEREKVLSGLPKYNGIEILYLEEGLYDRLAEHVLSKPGLHLVKQYKHILKKEYSERTLEKYRNELSEMVKSTASRNIYREWVSILKEMYIFEGGEAVVRDIVKEWRELYKNRPAMMSELNKLEV